MTVARPLRIRFEERLRPEGECVVYTGARNADGYGKIGSGGRGGRNVLAHRVAYELYVGPIPDGLRVLHRCDNPPCCNPAHLFVGTQADNLADMTAKGRRAWALPEEKRLAIVMEYLRGGVSQRVLAERHGVSAWAVHKWIKRYREGRLTTHQRLCQPTMPPRSSGKA